MQHKQDSKDVFRAMLSNAFCLHPTGRKVIEQIIVSFNKCFIRCRHLDARRHFLFVEGGVLLYWQPSDLTIRSDALKYTKCLKSYRKSVLLLLKYRFPVYFSRCSTYLQSIFGHSVYKHYTNKVEYHARIELFFGYLLNQFFNQVIIPHLYKPLNLKIKVKVGCYIRLLSGWNRIFLFRVASGFGYSWRSHPDLAILDGRIRIRLFLTVASGFCYSWRSHPESVILEGRIRIRLFLTVASGFGYSWRSHPDSAILDGRIRIFF